MDTLHSTLGCRFTQAESHRRIISDGDHISSYLKAFLCLMIKWSLRRTWKRAQNAIVEESSTLNKEVFCAGWWEDMKTLDGLQHTLFNNSIPWVLRDYKSLFLLPIRNLVIMWTYTSNLGLQHHRLLQLYIPPFMEIWPRVHLSQYQSPVLSNYRVYSIKALIDTQCDVVYYCRTTKETKKSFKSPLLTIGILCQSTSH